jgi:predicted  nucleic acid-binding Zn-ribbon protein
MSGPSTLFRTIHRLRRSAHDLQEKLEYLPRQLRAQQAKVARQEEQYREAQEAIKKLKVTAQKKEGELKDSAGHITRYERQLDEVTSKKEYDALQHEIATARAECARLEDEILTAMMEGEERATQLPAVEKAVQQAKDDFGRFESEAGARRGELMTHLTELQAQLKQAEAQVPADLRTQYARIITAKGHDGLAVVKGRTCSACYTEITVQNYTDMKQGHSGLCKSCGRILYLPEEAERREDEEN